MTRHQLMYFLAGMIIGCVLMAIGALVADEKIQEAYRKSETGAPPWARQG